MNRDIVNAPVEVSEVVVSRSSNSTVKDADAEEETGRTSQDTCPPAAGACCSCSPHGRFSTRRRGLPQLRSFFTHVKKLPDLWSVWVDTVLHWRRRSTRATSSIKLRGPWSGCSGFGRPDPAVSLQGVGCVRSILSDPIDETRTTLSMSPSGLVSLRRGGQGCPPSARGAGVAVRP